MNHELKKENIEDVYPMSDIQEGMVYHSLKDPGAGIYHNQLIKQFSMEGFDPGLFKKAVGLLVKKHGILRTLFNPHEYEEPLQIVCKEIPLDIEHYDISHMAKSDQEEYVKQLMKEDRQKPFKIGEFEPMWRIRTAALDKKNLALLWTSHHSIIDGWSYSSFITELNNTYYRLKQDPGFVPAPLKSTYKDFVIEQMARKEDKESIEYWRGELQDYKKLQWPGSSKDRTAPVLKNHTFTLPPASINKLKETARENNTSLKALTFAAYAYMMSMGSYENDLVLGLVADNRPLGEDGDKVLGCFLNTVPVRIKIPCDITWKEYILGIDKKLRILKRYDRMPFPGIVKISGEESHGRNPIFDTFFNFTDFHILKQAEHRYEPGESPDPTDRDNDMHLAVNSHAFTNTAFDFSIDTTMGAAHVTIAYDNSLVSDTWVKNCSGYFQRLLEKFIDPTPARIQKKDILSAAEKQQLLYDFNNTRIECDLNRTIHQLFQDQVQKTPDHVALVGEKEEGWKGRRIEGKKEDENSLRAKSQELIAVTYKELNKKSRQLAQLLSEKGVMPDVVVGIMLERSIAMIVGILGILKAGGAYLPIDPGYPAERINYMLADSNVKILLTAPGTQVKVKAEVEERSVEIVYIPNLSSSLTLNLTSTSTSTYQVSSADLAYIIYTSGSTGKPKGVMVEHGSVVNILFSLFKAYPLSPGDSWLLKTPFIFDVSVTELFGWFMGEARLVILGENKHWNPQEITRAIEVSQVTHINFVPSMFNLFLEFLDRHSLGKLKSLKYILLAGEALGEEVVRRYGDSDFKAGLENLYGPTEGTVYASSYSLNRGNYKDKVLIGKPLPNIKLYIFDKCGHLQPGGVPGELAISGVGTARGYLNNPGLSTGRFIENPYEKGERLYLTGDMACWLPNGNIDFLGRLDDQVKIKGFRVEPREIQHHLLNIHDIDEAFVTSGQEKNGKDKFLCAYIVSKTKYEPGYLRNCLSGKLPDYMIPSYFVQVDEIPVTVNGKVDIKALPSPGSGRAAGKEYQPPGNEIEETLAETWQEILALDKMSVNDDFFHLGGDSLKLVRLFMHIDKHYPKMLSIQDLFDNRTIRTCAALIAAKKQPHPFPGRNVREIEF
jgi:amino acid adenylation domain-containing protein